MNLKKQFISLHLYNFLFSLRITDAVWVVFLLDRGFSLAQVGIAEGVFHLVSFVCEIPSGMAADLLGRKRTLIATGLCGSASAVFMAFSTDFGGICLSMAFQALMYNLCSGTQEALTYDSLKAAGLQEQYLKRNAWLLGLSQTSAAISCALGGLAAALGFFRAYAVSALLSAVCGVTAMTLTEPLVTQSQRQRAERPFSGLGLRLKEHVILSVRFLREHPRTACKIFSGAAAGVPIYLTFMYLQQHLLNSGLPSVFLGGALLLVRFAGTAGVAVGGKLKARLFSCVILCAVCSGIGTVLAGFGWWIPALLGGMLAQFMDSIIALRLDASLNDDFPSDQRATLVSVDSMVYSLLMIAASPLTGAVGDALGASRALWLLGGCLVAAAPVFGAFYQFLLRKKRNV